MRRWLPWTLAGIGICIGLVWVVGLRSERIPVKTVAAARGRVEATVTNTKAGTVRARRRAHLSPQVAGRVVEVAQREGESVRAGALLIQLDDASQRAALQLARESLRAVEARRNEGCIQRDRARRELERKRELAAQKIVSADLLDSLESAYDAARAACESVSAEVDKARAQISLAEADLEKLALRAPFDGILAEVSAEVGEWITPAPPLLQVPGVIDVIDPASLYVSAPMDEVDSNAIRPGQSVVVSVDSRPGETFAGRVARVAPYVLDVEAQNRTVEIEVELDDVAVSSRLLPGTSSDVEVVLEVRDGVLRVPTPALLEGDRVLVADDGVLEERSVAIGLKNWDWVEVKSGIGEGQRVVLSLDRIEVKAGARVEAEPTEYRP